MSEPRILVTGCNGQLGRAICRRLGSAAAGLSRPDLDLDRVDAVAARLESLRPAAVINCAAYTQVDAAENHPQECFRVNSEAVAVMAAVCNRLDIPLVQVSSDYVFHGSADRGVPFTEDDEPNPQGVYARSKLAGEIAARQCRRSLVVRTCGLYGGHGKNFVDTMLRLGRDRDRVRVVGDQHCTPTYVEHVAQAICFLFSARQTGICHVVNGDSTTWYDFAKEIFRLAGLAVAVERITTADFGAAAPRPRYSVLDTQRYDQLGGPALPSWQAALRSFIAGREPRPPNS